ncbi:MAG: hypothetical protein ABSC42_14425, partial [Tepidisphaeraceae bacterium]
MKSLGDQQRDKTKSARKSKPKDEAPVGKPSETPHRASKHILNPNVGRALWGVPVFVAGCILWNNADKPIVWLLIPTFLSLLFAWLAVYRRFILRRKDWRRPILGTSVGVILTWIGYFIVTGMILNPPHPTEAVTPQPIQPNASEPTSRPTVAAPESRSRFSMRQMRCLMVLLGNVVCGTDADTKTPMVFRPFPNTAFTFNGNDVSLDAIFTDGIWRAQMINNELVSYPFDWDMNQDGQFVEIVNGQKRPVFQMLTTSDPAAFVRGIFWINDQKIAVSAAKENFGGLRITSIGNANLFTFPPIFKYPSSNFPRQRVVNYPVPTRTLEEYVKEICGVPSIAVWMNRAINNTTAPIWDDRFS